MSKAGNNNNSNSSGSRTHNNNDDNDNNDLYTILNLDSNKATNDDVQQSYKKLSRTFHPDKIFQIKSQQKQQQQSSSVSSTASSSSSQNNDDEEEDELFIQFKNAYDILSDPILRIVYDEYGLYGVNIIKRLIYNNKNNHNNNHDDDEEDRDNNNNDDKTDGNNKERYESTGKNKSNEESDDDDDHDETEGEKEPSLYTILMYLYRNNQIDNMRIILQDIIEQTEFESIIIKQNGINFSSTLDFPCSINNINNSTSIFSLLPELNKAQIGFNVTQQDIHNKNLPSNVTTTSPDSNSNDTIDDKKFNVTIGGSSTIATSGTKQSDSTGSISIGYKPISNTNCNFDINLNDPYTLSIGTTRKFSSRTVITTKLTTIPMLLGTNKASKPKSKRTKQSNNKQTTNDDTTTSSTTNHYYQPKPYSLSIITQRSLFIGQCLGTCALGFGYPNITQIHYYLLSITSILHNYHPLLPEQVTCKFNLGIDKYPIKISMKKDFNLLNKLYNYDSNIININKNNKNDNDSNSTAATNALIDNPHTGNISYAWGPNGIEIKCIIDHIISTSVISSLFSSSSSSNYVVMFSWGIQHNNKNGLIWLLSLSRNDDITIRIPIHIANILDPNYTYKFCFISLLSTLIDNMIYDIIHDTICNKIIINTITNMKKNKNKKKKKKMEKMKKQKSMSTSTKSKGWRMMSFPFFTSTTTATAASDNKEKKGIVDTKNKPIAPSLLSQPTISLSSSTTTTTADEYYYFFKSKQDAYQQKLLMTKTSNTIRENEKLNNGLVILKATYYIIVVNNDDEKNDESSASKVIIEQDVTIQIQFFVQKSKLKLPSTSKSHLLGIYSLVHTDDGTTTTSIVEEEDKDTNENDTYGSSSSSRNMLINVNWWKCRIKQLLHLSSSSSLSTSTAAVKATTTTRMQKEKPKLTIRYEINGNVYEITINDDDELNLPDDSPKACLLGKSNLVS